MMHPSMQLTAGEMTREQRHVKRGIYAGGHLVTDFPPDVVGLASAIFQFHASCPEAHRRLQALADGYRLITAGQVAQLLERRCYGWARQATSGLYMREPQELLVRPSCVWAGGETIRAA